MPRLLAIDYGTRRIGLAVGDRETRLASPLRVLEVTSPQYAIEQILLILEDEDVEELVVGLPLNMDGSIGKMARDTVRWAQTLADRANQRLIFVDERLSSFAAEQRLIERRRAGEDLTRGRKKQRRDALAAAGFLQAYLDGDLRAIILREGERTEP